MRLVLASIVLLFSSLAFSETYDISTAESRVEFLAIGNPGFLKVEGKSNTLTGELTVEKGTASGEFSLPVKSLKTGMKMRDNHMKDEYLEAKKYPEIKFTLAPVKLSNKFKASGVMNLHGVEESVKWDCQAGSNDGAKKISCVTKIMLTDFNIKIPSFGGVTVAKEVSLKVSIVL